MASIFTDNFNSYIDGNLNGQDVWVGGTAFQVQGTTYYADGGAKAVQVINPTEQSIVKIGTALAAGQFGVYAQQSVTNVYGVRFILGPGAAHALMNFREDGNIYGQYSGGTVSIAPYSANTWYWLLIEWRSSPSHQVRFSVDSGTPTSWYTPLNDWTDTVDRGGFYANSGTYTGYWDYIAENSYVPPTGQFMSPQKGYW